MYYLFIFSIPFLSVELGFGSSLSSLVGYVFALATLLKPRLCYKRIDKALWFFGIYLLIYVLFGLWTILDLPDSSVALANLQAVVRTLLQLFVLFWISTNLLADDRVARKTLFTFAAGCIVLAILQTAGFAGEVESVEGRETAFGTNPNVIADLLGLGLLALIALAYGQQKINGRARVLFWLFSAILFLGIVRTGSRGAIVGVVAGCSVFVIQRTNLFRRLRLGVIVVLSLIFVVIASYNIESVRERWERTFAEGDTAGRDEIFDQGVEMFLEKPILGWGPVYHQIELAQRVHYPGYARDFHNLYLHLLTEVGVLGSVPFFAGIFLCCWCAWKARKTSQGIAPLAMLVNILIISLVGTPITDRTFWLVLAYACASATYPVLTLRQSRFFPSLSIQRRAPVRLH
jgi:O-antigen ligase